MKRVLFYFLLLSIALISFVSRALAQINVASTNGFTVDINVQPTSITPSSTSCMWGYTYNVNLNYQVTFVGSNKPASLYTLQGTVGCSSATSSFDLPDAGGTGTVSAANAWRSASDCNSITPISLACNTISIEISGPGISSRTVSYPVVYTPLPITLIDFNASVEKKFVKLSWATSSETNNDHFLVERSIDANKWNAIEEINGALNSTTTQEYTYYDRFPIDGIVYYRLKEVDPDGHFSSSKIVSANFHSQNSSINVFPVPNRGNNIGIHGITDYKDYDMTLTDISGKIIYTNPAISSSMDLPPLNTGIYMLRFTNRQTNESSTIRYMKL